MADEKTKEEATRYPAEAIQARQNQARDIERLRERLMASVEDPYTPGCWNWTAGMHPSGYGRFFMYGDTYMAHRAAFIIFKRPLRPDEFVLHQCDNKRCVNPAHLKAGTHADNMREAAERGRFKAHNRILTDEDVLEIRATFKRRDGEAVRLGNKYGVNHSTITSIMNGHSYQHLYARQPKPGLVQATLFDPPPSMESVSEARPKGEAHHRAKLTAALVVAMRNDYANGATLDELCAKYPVKKAQASAIVRNKAWRHVNG